MSKFAKLYDYEDGLQVLVKIDDNEQGYPEVRFFFSPEDFGICSVAIIFQATDKGYERCDNLFRKTTKESALSHVEEIVREFKAV
jgi:hypothetical protein